MGHVVHGNICFHQQNTLYNEKKNHEELSFKDHPNLDLFLVQMMVKVSVVFSNFLHNSDLFCFAVSELVLPLFPLHFAYTPIQQYNLIKIQVHRFTTKASATLPLNNNFKLYSLSILH